MNDLLGPIAFGVSEFLLVSIGVGLQYYYARFFDLVLPLAFISSGAATSILTNAPGSNVLISLTLGALLVGFLGAVVNYMSFAGHAGGGSQGSALLLRSLGLQMLFLGLYSLTLDDRPRSVKISTQLDGSPSVFGSLVENGVLSLAGAFVVFWLVWGIQYTQLGLSLRAIAEDKDRASIRGIDTRRALTLNAFAAYSSVGLAGGLHAVSSTVTPSAGWPPVLFGAMIAVLAASPRPEKLVIICVIYGTANTLLQLAVDPLASQSILVATLLFFLLSSGRRRKGFGSIE